MENPNPTDELRNEIEQSAVELTGSEEHIRLADLHKIDSNFWDMNKIQQFTDPASWRIVKRGEDDNEMEEVIFTVRGVIHTKELPPVRMKPKIQAHRYRFLQQGVTLTGLQSPTFTNATDAIRLIHSHFDRQFQEGILEEHAKDMEVSENMDQIGMWNRYLTLVREAKDMQAIAFLPGVDPTGTLRSMAQEDSNCTYIHTEDNQVHYYITRRDNAGGVRYERCEPQVFRVGDIVEAQVSFVVIPVKGGRCKMLTVLQSLALIKENFKKTETQTKSIEHRKAKVRLIKRKAGYGHEQESRYKKKRADNMVIETEIHRFSHLD